MSRPQRAGCGNCGFRVLAWRGYSAFRAAPSGAGTLLPGAGRVGPGGLRIRFEGFSAMVWADCGAVFDSLADHNFGPSATGSYFGVEVRSLPGRSAVPAAHWRTAVRNSADG